MALSLIPGWYLSFCCLDDFFCVPFCHNNAPSGVVSELLLFRIPTPEGAYHTQCGGIMDCGSVDV